MQAKPTEAYHLSRTGRCTEGIWQKMTTPKSCGTQAGAGNSSDVAGTFQSLRFAAATLRLFSPGTAPDGSAGECASRTHDSYTKRSSAPNGILPNSFPTTGSPQASTSLRSSFRHASFLSCSWYCFLRALRIHADFVGSYSLASLRGRPWLVDQLCSGRSFSERALVPLSETKFSERTMFSKGTILRRSYQVVVPAKRPASVPHSAKQPRPRRQAGEGRSLHR